MRFLKILLYLILAILAAYVVFCFIGPKDFNVTRTVRVGAAPEAIFEEISNFQNWASWSPWAKRDPEMINQFAGDAGTVGHSQTWESKKEGSGSQTIVELRENEFMRTELRFKGWDGSNFSNFILEQVGDTTALTWTMEGGDLPFFFRGLMYLMGGKKAIENDYDQGLADLKALAEAKPKGPRIELSSIDDILFVGRRMKLKMADLTEAVYETSFDMIMKAIGDSTNVGGMPMAINHAYNPETGEIDIEIAIPVKKAVKVPKGLQSGLIPAGPCVKLVYTGPYEGLGEQWEQFMPAVMSAYRPRYAPYEIYVSDPGTPGMTPDKYVTWLMQPVEM